MPSHLASSPNTEAQRILIRRVPPINNCPLFPRSKPQVGLTRPKRPKQTITDPSQRQQTTTSVRSIDTQHKQNNSDDVRHELHQRKHLFNQIFSVFLLWIKRWWQLRPTRRTLHLDGHPSCEAALVKHVFTWSEHVVFQSHVYRCIADGALDGEDRKAPTGRYGTEEVGGVERPLFSRDTE